MNKLKSLQSKKRLTSIIVLKIKNQERKRQKDGKTNILINAIILLQNEIFFRRNLLLNLIPSIEQTNKHHYEKKKQ